MLNLATGIPEVKKDRRFVFEINILIFLSSQKQTLLGLLKV